MRRLENDPSKFCKSALLAHKPRDIHMHETVRKTSGSIFNPGQRSLSVARFQNKDSWVVDPAASVRDNDYASSFDHERIPEVFTSTMDGWKHDERKLKNY